MIFMSLGFVWLSIVAFGWSFVNVMCLWEYELICSGSCVDSTKKIHSGAYSFLNWTIVEKYMASGLKLGRLLLGQWGSMSR